MDTNVLVQIQDVVMQYIDIITNITKVSVDVVDTNYVRIAGTGIFSGLINKSTEGQNYIEKKR